MRKMTGRNIVPARSSLHICGKLRAERQARKKRASYGKNLYSLIYFLFFFNDTATTEIYTLSLHDALPICSIAKCRRILASRGASYFAFDGCRSEEHTSELQSHLKLVCRLLLEKKKNTSTASSTSTSRRPTRRSPDSTWPW